MAKFGPVAFFQPSEASKLPTTGTHLMNGGELVVGGKKNFRNRFQFPRVDDHPEKYVLDENGNNITVCSLRVVYWTFNGETGPGDL